MGRLADSGLREEKNCGEEEKKSFGEEMGHVKRAKGRKERWESKERIQCSHQISRNIRLSGHITLFGTSRRPGEALH